MLWVVGELLTFKIGGQDADGAFAFVEEVTPPQGGPPPHLHTREDETFYVLEGELEPRRPQRKSPVIQLTRSGSSPEPTAVSYAVRG
jgi:uncharacterized cupin superfamily protein